MPLHRLGAAAFFGGIGMKNKSGKLALGGVMTALALVFLLLSAVPVAVISVAEG